MAVFFLVNLRYLWHMNNIGISFYTFLFFINVLAFGLYATDKRRACYNRWRIPEFILLVVALIGGAYGAGAGMLLFRHKTLHRLFLITVPVCFILWIILLIILCIYSSPEI